MFVDTFCTGNSKAVWLAIVIICGPLGTCFGYSLTGALTSCGYRWTISFIMLALSQGVCFVLFMFIPSSYINLKQVRREMRIYKRQFQNNPQDGSSPRTGSISSQEGSGSEEDEEEIGTVEAFGKLMRNYTFLFIMLATSGMLYMVSGILFWASDYLRDVLEVPKDDVTLYFAIVSITSPVLGAVVSFPVVSYVIKGYRNYSTLPVCFWICATSAVICVFMPMYQSIVPVLMSIWGGLFLGGIMLPIYQGVMLANVEDKLKAKS